MKREVELLGQVPPETHGAEITVLDISMAVNAAALRALLEGGNRVRWFDHHEAGRVPKSGLLEAHLDASPSVCTSLLVDRHLGGRERLWAIAAAFGDNLSERAQELAAGLAAPEIEALQEIGETLNYNAYGEERADLCAWPAEVYHDLHAYTAPFDYRKRSTLFARIFSQKQKDEGALRAAQEIYRGAEGVVLALDEGAAARRLLGIFANEIARREPALAHGVLVRLKSGGFRVSLRAPLERPCGASRLALQFPSGGGRAGAAGINHLPESDRDLFISKFKEAFAPPC